MSFDIVPPPPPYRPVPPSPPKPAVAQCTLCETPITTGSNRCTECGLYQELGPEKPNPFRQRTAVLVAGALSAVYLIVLGIVAIIPHAR